MPARILNPSQIFQVQVAVNGGRKDPKGLLLWSLIAFESR